MSRYTGSDIEVHLCNVLEGQPLDGLDEDASNAKARKLVEDVLMDAYPTYTVSVFMAYNTFGPMRVEGFPDEVEPEAILDVVHYALENVEAYYVASEE